jgi:tRNA-uridine 2-sulfurtransferase
MPEALHPAAGAPLPPPGPALVALSGGVDSAVAALLLQRAGYRVHGVHMKNWEDDDTFGACPHAQELADVQAVAGWLRVPLTVVNFAREYRAQVFEEFLAEHRAGRTPNPDVLCNVRIKFGVLADWARAQGFAMLATGHYAALERSGGAA